MALCVTCGERAGYGRQSCEQCEEAANARNAQAASGISAPKQPWQAPKRIRRVQGGNGPAQSTPSLPAVPPLLALGGVLLTAGLIGIVFALQMDTSVETSSYYGESSRVNNVGLMNDRIVYLAASGVAAVIGTILVVANLKRS